MIGTRITLALALGLLGPFASASESGPWMSDLGPAMQAAQTQGKDLLVDFTGSDWCGWCIRLHNEVFRHEEFLDYAQEHFVLVALDFPREDGDAWNAMSADLRERNQTQSEAFGVTGFPTVLLMTPSGVAYARTGYEEGGPSKYVANLEQLRASPERKDLLAADQRLAVIGDETPDAELDAIYELLGNVVSERQVTLLNLIARLDPADSHLVLARDELDQFLRTHLATEEPDFDAAAKAMNALAERRPSVRQLVTYYYYRGMIAVERSDSQVARESLEQVDNMGGIAPRYRDALADRVTSLEQQG